MALKPTILKARVSLSDSDRGVFEDLELTLAQHPSENRQRLMARLLAYCLQWQPALEFTRGLSTTDEPDIWQLSDAGDIQRWIEIGQPDSARLRKACGRAQQVLVFAYASGADTWWSLNRESLGKLPRTQIWQLSHPDIETISTAVIARNMRLNISIVGGTMYIDNGEQALDTEPQLLWESREDGA
ncbi:MAG: YaeQ family protein [Gammaproteobacteria bacterium]|nr:YaeQ family protein [Gammaproteobacteria bacterium]